MTTRIRSDLQDGAEAWAVLTEDSITKKLSAAEVRSLDNPETRAGLNASQTDALDRALIALSDQNI